MSLGGLQLIPTYKRQLDPAFLRRFTSKFALVDGGCWEWQAGRMPNGYGCITVSGRTRYAHRVSYEVHAGPIQDGLSVLHRCDNRRCVNPEHLFLGTALDNRRDCIRKGRARYAMAEQHGLAKLTKPVAEEIRRAYSTGRLTMRELGEAHDVAASTIWRVIHDHHWKEQAA